MKCVRCGMPSKEVFRAGRYFKRISPLGGPGLFVCAPDCDYQDQTVYPGAEEFAGMSDDESTEHQLTRWLEGKPLHNPIVNQCCPDFSCCEPSLLMDEPARDAFVRAYRRGDRGACAGISGLAMDQLAAKQGGKIVIAGDTVMPVVAGKPPTRH